MSIAPVRGLKMREAGKRGFPAIHPGEFVLEDCLKPLDLSITAGAKALGVTRLTLGNLVNAFWARCASLRQPRGSGCEERYHVVCLTYFKALTRCLRQL